MQNYKILAKPNLTNVIRGKIMSFSLQRINPNAPALEHIRASWICYNHISYRNHDKYRAKPVNGPRNSLEWNEAKWSIEGQHKVVCQIKYSNNTEYVEHIQNVINAKQTVAYSSNTFEESENPFIFYKNLSEQIEWIRREEKHQQLSDEDEKAYQNRMESIEKFKEKLKFLLDKIPNDCRDNFISVSVKHIASFYGDAESISLRVGCFCYDKEAYLIDWTNPLERIACGVYVGKGDNEEEAIREAINSWDNENRYPEGIMKGRIQYETNKMPIEDNKEDEGEETIKIEGEAHLPQINVTPPRLIEIEFETDGKSDLDTLSDFLNTLALAAVIVAGIITLVAPVPGSRVVSGLIWASVAASTTSAVINIADRHSDGFSNWRDDSLDTLTIIANAFSAGTLSAGTKWVSKALILTNISQKQVVKITLIGQISADSLQGILVTEELALAIYSVMNNKEIPADIKLSKISALLSRGVIDGILITVNIHGNRQNLTALALKNETPPSRIMMSLEEVDQYISGKKVFNKVDIGASLSNKSKTKTPPEPNKMDVNNKIDKNITMMENLVNDIGNLTPQMKDDQLTKPVTVQVNDNGSKTTLSAIYSPKWLMESVEQRSIINGDEFFEKWLLSNLEEGKKLSSLMHNKSTGEGKTNTHESGSINLGEIHRTSDTNTPESKTSVSTNHGTENNHGTSMEDLTNELNNMRNSGMTPKEIAKRVALAQTRCPVEGITSQANFYNLQTPSYRSLKKSEKGNTEAKKTEQDKKAIIEAINEKEYRFIDVEEYMKLLKKSYQDSSTLYPNVTANFTEMHPTTERLIREFIANNKKFRIIDGLPGMHAEVLSTNNVFQQLEAKGKNVEAYLDKIEVYTIRLTVLEQGQPFPACRHCSGILAKSKGISIPTGRVDD